MKAALATRPAAEIQARLAALAQQASTITPVNGFAPTQVLIFNGFMLDTRVTVTYFSMGVLFIYLMVGLNQWQDVAKLF